ncbi:hypothetical protein AB205_0130610, partial [Aquarana catesbeiana]
MWLPMIQSNIKHLSAGLQLRLHAIQNNANQQNLRMLQGSAQFAHNSAVLRKWLQCTQFKMAQLLVTSAFVVLIRPRRVQMNGRGEERTNVYY